MPRIIPQQKRVCKFLLRVAHQFVVRNSAVMTKKTVGERISDELKRSSPPISQAEFCRRIGITTETFRKWKAGITAPTRSRSNQIAKAIGKTPEWVMYGTDEPSLSEILSPSTPLELGVGDPLRGGLQVATTQAPLNDGITWELYVNMLKEGVDLSGGVWVVITDDANSPEINPGDQVYVARQEPKPGNYCVFGSDDGDIILRKMQRTIGAKFDATALNSNYAKLSSEAAGLVTLGVVTKHLRSMT